MTKGHFQSHYIPNTPGEQAGMLASLGVSSIDELFADIPEEHRNPPLRLPDPLPELEIQRELGALAGRNRTLGSGPSFLGAGSYHHFIPSIVKSLVTRGEFITAYTPYQAEASQGTLQVIYEFQTLVCNLYGMEVANAGMYDGATSLAEAALMACRVTRRERIAVLDTVSPAYRAVIEAYCRPQNLEVATISDAAPGRQRRPRPAWSRSTRTSTEPSRTWGRRWTRPTMPARWRWCPAIPSPWGCSSRRATTGPTS